MRVRLIGRNAKRSKRLGSAAVEMAVVASLVFVPVTYGMIEISRALQVKEFLTGSARSAAFVAIRAGGANSAVTSNVNTTLTAYGIDPALATVTVTVNGVVADCSTAKQGDQITLKISIPASSVNWMLPMYMSNSAVESENIVMMRQG